MKLRRLPSRVFVAAALALLAFAPLPFPVSAQKLDTLIYTIRLSQVLGVDLLAAAEAKLVANAVKYPVEKSRGNAKKYTRLA